MDKCPQCGYVEPSAQPVPLKHTMSKYVLESGSEETVVASNEERLVDQQKRVWIRSDKFVAKKALQLTSDTVDKNKAKVAGQATSVSPEAKQ